MCPAMPLAARPTPRNWAAPCTSTECSMHQLSPYIGKLKSSIAHDLIARYSRPRQLVADPFAGSGTIPLEAALLGRRVFASDISPYAYLLSRAKLSPPHSLDAALRRADQRLALANSLPPPDLRTIPQWVRRFFHPRTLKEVLPFAHLCRQKRDYFLLACLLGILHHQRPGFLSHPSSHLVPYLRTNKFPVSEHPHLYDYRPLAPRLRAKIRRAYSRYQPSGEALPSIIRRSNINSLRFPDALDCLITSPPYMNALDYARDNRLRLWFLAPSTVNTLASHAPQTQTAFENSIRSLATKTQASLRIRGHCILIVGEEVQRNRIQHPAQLTLDIFSERAPELVPIAILSDTIPDVRRSRRHYHSVKREFILVFQRV